MAAKGEPLDSVTLKGAAQRVPLPSPQATVCEDHPLSMDTFKLWKRLQQNL